MITNVQVVFRQDIQEAVGAMAAGVCIIFTSSLAISPAPLSRGVHDIGCKKMSRWSLGRMSRMRLRRPSFET